MKTFLLVKRLLTPLLFGLGLTLALLWIMDTDLVLKAQGTDIVINSLADDVGDDGECTQ